MEIIIMDGGQEPAAVIVLGLQQPEVVMPQAVMVLLVAIWKPNTILGETGLIAVTVMVALGMDD